MMFDPKFDPLQELQLAQQQIRELQIAMHQLVQSHNAQAHLLKQISEQNTQLLDLIGKSPWHYPQS